MSNTILFILGATAIILLAATLIIGIKIGKLKQRRIDELDEDIKRATDFNKAEHERLKKEGK